MHFIFADSEDIFYMRRLVDTLMSVNVTVWPAAGSVVRVRVALLCGYGNNAKAKALVFFIIEIVYNYWKSRINFEYWRVGVCHGWMPGVMP